MSHHALSRSPAQRAAYRAVRDQAAAFADPPRSTVILSGPDRAAFLHNFCTQDIKQLQPGKATEAFVTTHQARVLAWIQVAALSDRLIVTAESDLGTKLAAHLERYHISEAVEVQDATAAFVSRFVAGPSAAAMLGSALERDALVLPPDHVEETGPDRLRGTVLRLDWFGGPGYFVILPREGAQEFDQRLQALGVVAGDATTWNDFRVRHGVPAYGADIDETNLPQEVNRTGRAISFTKGCYLGQEPVARIHALGHVNRLLLPLRLRGESLDSSTWSGAKLQANGQDAGQVTSFGRDPDGDGWLALGYVRRGYQDPGTELSMYLASGQSARAEVDARS